MKPENALTQMISLIFSSWIAITLFCKSAKKRKNYYGKHWSFTFQTPYRKD